MMAENLLRSGGYEIGKDAARLWFIAAIAGIQIALVVSLSFEYRWIYYLILLIALLPLIFLVRSKVYILLGLIPISQAFPLDIGSRSIGFFPEYVVVPFLFVLCLMNRLKAGDYEFERTGLVFPAFMFILVAALSLFQAYLLMGFSRIIPGIGALYIYIISLAVFILLLDWLKTEEQVRKVFLGFFLGCLLVALTGIFEYVFNAGHSARFYRITSLFDTLFWKEGGGNPNSLGAYLMMICLFGIALRKEFRGKEKIILWLAVVTGSIALILTSSRSSLVGFVAGLLIIAVIRDRRIFYWLIPLGVASVLYLLSLPRITDRISSIVAISTDPKILKLFVKLDPKLLDWESINNVGLLGYNIDIVAGAMRITSWLTGIKTFFAHPVLGIGLKLNQFYSGSETAENYLLDIAIMTGIFGLLAMIWLFVRVVVIARMANKSPISSFWISYRYGFIASFIGLIIVSMTGSVLFTMKLSFLFTVFVAMLWRSKQTVPRNIQDL